MLEVWKNWDNRRREKDLRREQGWGRTDTARYGRQRREERKRKTSTKKCAESSTPSCHFHCLPPSLVLCHYANISSPKSRKSERSFGSILSDRFLHWRKYGRYYWEEKHKRGGVVSVNTQEGLILVKLNQGLGLQHLQPAFPPSLLPVMLSFSASEWHYEAQSATSLMA